MELLRTPQTEEAYRLFRESEPAGVCALCASVPAKQFEHWKIFPDQFPYDKIASTHDMLVPLRHVRERDLSPEERAELLDIKEQYIDARYEHLLENVSRLKTVPSHYHLHLLVFKEHSL